MIAATTSTRSGWYNGGMQDQNPITPEAQAPPQTSEPAKIVDIVTRSAPVEPVVASVAVPDSELVSEPAVEPAPAPAPVEVRAEAGAAQRTTKEAAQKQATQQVDAVLATPTQPKQPSTVPIGAIIAAIVVFLVLASIALIAFRQGF